MRNLDPMTTEAKILEVFTELSEGGEVERVKKNKDYAFVHFLNREDAELALEKVSYFSQRAP